MTPITPIFERHGHSDPWDCLACAWYLRELSPADPEAGQQPDTRPRWWRSFGPTDASEDPCGRPPLTLITSKEKAQ